MTDIAKKHEFRALTGIRGIAAVFVAFYHFKIYDYFSGPSETIMRHGYLSVDLFFILSGFIMSYTYAHLFRDGFSGRNFYIFMGRRVSRIYPLYIFMTALFMAFIGFRMGNIPETTRLEPLPVAANILMVQAWGIARSYLAVAWSISTEWAAYLIFPALAAVTLFSKTRTAVATGIMSIALLWGLAHLPAEQIHIERFKGPLDISEPTDYGPLARCLIEFTLGLLSYRLFESGILTRVSAHKAASLVAGLLLVGLMAFKEADFWIVLVMPFLIITLANDRSWLSQFMGSRVVHYLGVLSYSIYLVHFLAIVGRKRIFNFLSDYDIPHLDIVMIVIQCALTFAFAVFTYNVIEKPGRKILRNVFEPGKKINPVPKPDSTPP